MIYTNDFNKFYTIISDLKASGAFVSLYGKCEEAGPNMYSESSTPPNNKLVIHIAALTPAGTIFCDSIIKFDEKNTVENCKVLLDELDIKDAEVSYLSTNGTITIK